MTREFINEIVQMLANCMKDNILSARFDEQTVIEDFAFTSTMFSVSTLTVTTCDKDEYYDEEEFLLYICNDVVDNSYGLGESSDERASLFEKVCSVASSHLAELRLVAREELTLVERGCTTLGIGPHIMRTFMQA